MAYGLLSNLLMGAPQRMSPPGGGSLAELLMMKAQGNDVPSVDSLYGRDPSMDLPMGGGTYPGQQYPSAPSQQQPSGGGFFDSLLAPEMALPMAGRLIAGPSSGQGIGSALDFAGQSFGKLSEQRKAEAAQNQSLQIITQKRPDLAELVKGGMPIKQAWDAMLTGEKQQSLINAGDGRLYDPNTKEWINAPASEGSGGPFEGTSVEAQSLNYLVKNGQLTAEQAAQLGAGKTVTNPADGSVMFMTPQGVFSKPAEGGTVSPVPPSSGGGGAGMIPLTGAKPVKPTEQQIRNRSLYKVVEPELKILKENFSALKELGNQVGSGAKYGGVDASGYLTSPAYQRAKGSLKTIIASYLYSVSGATANPGEVENQADILTPKPGESDAAIADKLARVDAMVSAIKDAGGETGGGVLGGGKTSGGVQWSVEP